MLLFQDEKIRIALEKIKQANIKKVSECVASPSIRAPIASRCLVLLIVMSLTAPVMSHAWIVCD